MIGCARTLFLATAGMMALTAGVSGCSKGQAGLSPRVVINGRTWSVELALTWEQQYRGLSGRSELAQDAGMLFVFPAPDVLVFCMRGCDFPLDIAFIDDAGKVIRIYTMAVEADRQGKVPYSSVSPARYALETAAGSLRKAGVKVGDQVTFLDIPGMK